MWHQPSRPMGEFKSPLRHQAIGGKPLVIPEGAPQVKGRRLEESARLPPEGARSGDGSQQSDGAPRIAASTGVNEGGQGRPQPARRGSLDGPGIVVEHA
jgi:hypothetical protein